MKKRTEMKKAFTETLMKIMETNKSIIVCDADLANSSGERKLFDFYPDRTVDFGISEANMAAAAAGLSLTGLKPIIHSFAPFVTRRIMDQVYTSLGFSKNNCLIYGSDPGYWSKYNGPTHTTFEDIAVMTSIPGMTVVAPSDAQQWSWILQEYAENGGLYYVRVPRQEVEDIYPSDQKFEFGKGIEIYDGDEIAIMTCGPELSDVKEIVENYRNQGVKIGVYDLFFLKPLDNKMIQAIIKKYKKIITVENHNYIGGIGQQIAYSIATANQSNKPILKSLAVNDRYGEVGTIEYLKEQYCIDKKTIENTIQEIY